MANNSYVINDLALPGQSTVTVADDGTGTDWLVLNGTYTEASDIRLSWWSVGGVSTQASGAYFDAGGGNRLIVDGFIENVRGSASADFIQGNEGGNELWGDTTDSSVGGSDTISGGAGDDTIYGGAGADSLSGEADNDLLFGGAGNDTIYGGAGVDTIIGGGGADVLSGGATAGDTVGYANSGAGVQIDITFGSTTVGIGGAAQGDQISGFTDVIGSKHNDVIRDTVAGTIAFGYNNNTFRGGAGADVLQMGGGDDRAYGGTGNDSIYGGDGKDMLRGEAGADRIFGGNGRDAVYGGDGGDLLSGGAQNDRMYGGNGDDRMNGGAGNDVLVGGAGKDVMTGGGGFDTFVFNSISETGATEATADHITDLTYLNPGQHDTIDLRGIDANVTAGHAGDDAFTLIGGNFNGVAGELRVYQSGGHYVIAGDVDGDATADFMILFDTVTGWHIEL
jgi:Ca2+-binding RTX toxin-like protein